MNCTAFGIVRTECPFNFGRLEVFAKFFTQSTICCNLTSNQESMGISSSLSCSFLMRFCHSLLRSLHILCSLVITKSLPLVRVTSHTKKIQTILKFMPWSFDT